MEILKIRLSIQAFYQKRFLQTGGGYCFYSFRSCKVNRSGYHLFVGILQLTARQGISKKWLYQLFHAHRVPQPKSQTDALILSA
jgi:hypothetical protein